MPKLCRQTFETAIIERYQRRESSVEEALIKSYLAGVSVRRVEDITDTLWGTLPWYPGRGFEPEQEDIRQDRGMAPAHPEGEHPSLHLNGIVMKRRAVANNRDGYRKILAYAKEPRKISPTGPQSCGIWLTVACRMFNW
nr:transposase [uncultured Cohaesibacter sp.]